MCNVRAREPNLTDRQWIIRFAGGFVMVAPCRLGRHTLDQSCTFAAGSPGNALLGVKR
ncbi:hypothetical protein BIFGAL_02915 [Bifidobacterium gallicum DSM 20093 = LMG 11596]|uniref:Uncharacterized protein n=1 Tax=Bifidobacterium gallicum DSM 20093 = LMG 11596 TaxID=561180 RepID=D1NT04_9BIFI|nr:hypothetical protein BIFGAL_02915 [Bifidobacterium gallicum DSM 20093 = LMG 11596]